MPNLSSQTKKVSMIINIPNNMSISTAESRLEEFISKYCSNWFYILHDKDTKAETGELKTPHFHLLFVANDNKLHRLRWYILRCSECFQVETLQLFSAEIMKNYESAVQYLNHKNDKDKYQYDISEIHCFDKKELTEIMKLTVTPTLTIDRIINVCLESSSLTDCYYRLGIGVSQMYRNLIKDIWMDTMKGYRKQ